MRWTKTNAYSTASGRHNVTFIHYTRACFCCCPGGWKIFVFYFNESVSVLIPVGARSWVTQSMVRCVEFPSGLDVCQCSLTLACGVKDLKMIDPALPAGHLACRVWKTLLLHLHPVFPVILLSAFPPALTQLLASRSLPLPADALLSY
jgi:hypothetical protein